MSFDVTTLALAKTYTDQHSGGGVGMGITGATVGQIAKISAVDDNGVPTAWEPVDMPSGVTDDYINSLIDTKLGVIENGSY